MSISTPFIKRPVATSLLMAAFILVGLAAYPFLPVAPLPRVDFPTIVVTGKLPGGSPEIMASTVAQPLETQFAQIPGVAQLTSVSVLGQTAVTIQFDLDRNIDAAAGDVQAAINAASGQLPKNLPSPPTYRKVNPSDSPILILSVQSDAVPLIKVDDYADTILSQQLSQIAGVSQVLIGGEQKRAIRVQVDPAKLAAMGLTLEDVHQVLTTVTLAGAKGSIDGDKRSYAIYDNDQLTHASQYDNVIIAYRNGAAVRIRDIGRAVDAAENDEFAAWQNGQRGIILLIFKQPGANVIDTVERIKQALPHLEAAIPPSVHVSTISDRTLTIRASVADVQFTLMLSIALVVMVIFIFLRSVWATIIPSITVPVALICTFAVMFLLDFSLDNLSLMALTIAVGFVVDDAIVMLENIFRHIEDGMKPMEAAIKGAGEIGFTIVSISFSLVAVFIPLLLMGGIVGRLFREFAMTVTIAVLVSAFVSLTLTPMMCSRFLRHHSGTHGWLYRVIEGLFDGILAFYRRTLDIALRHQFITLMVFLATVALTGLPVRHHPQGLLPRAGHRHGDRRHRGRAGHLLQARCRASSSVWPPWCRPTPTPTATSRRWVPASAGRPATTGASSSASSRWDQRVGGSAQDYIARLRPKLAKVEGGAAFPAGRPGHPRRRPAVQDASTSTRCRTPTWPSCTSGRRRSWPSCRRLPMLRDVTTDQQMAGTTATLTIDRDAAARFGIQPQAIDDIAVRRLRPEPDHAVFLPGELLPPDPGGAAEHAG